MSKSKLFVLICIAFCTGVILGSKFNIAQPYVYITAAVFVLVFALLVLYRGIVIPTKVEGSLKLQNLSDSSAHTNKLVLGRNDKIWLVPLFLFFVCLGILRIQSSFQESQFAPMLESKQSLEGVIVKDVDMRQTFQMLTVKPEGYSQNILVTATKTSKFFYGDKVWITGKITEAKEFDDFDYKGYLERQNVYALMKYPKVIILKTSAGNPVVEKLLRLKYIFISQVNKVLAEPYSSLLLGILIGAKKSLPQEIIDNFNATGTSHIIAISGYNISVLVGALAFLRFYSGRKISFWLTLAIIFAFVIISGASASVVRAAVMGALLLTSFGMGRLYAITPALCFAAVTMLLFNPRILYWDVGFQLSFLATMGIVYGMPLLQELTSSWPKFFGAKLTFLTTMCAIIATLPLIAFQFGTVSLVAPVVNILVLPVVPPAMFFGFFSALPFFGQGFGFIDHWLLFYMLKTIEVFGHSHYAFVNFKLKTWQFYLFYFFILLGYLLLRLAVARRKAGSVEKPFSMW